MCFTYIYETILIFPIKYVITKEYIKQTVECNIKQTPVKMYVNETYNLQVNKYKVTQTKVTTNAIQSEI